MLLLIMFYSLYMSIMSFLYTLKGAILFVLSLFYVREGKTLKWLSSEAYYKRLICTKKDNSFSVM